MELKGFKKIFYLEFFHRLLGSSLGGIYTIPFIAFWSLGWLKSRNFKIRLGILLGLGGS